MNVVLRNYPKPPQAHLTPDCGLSRRRQVVAEVCEAVNELIEYAYFEGMKAVLVPAQSNIDERMPLTFLRPCIDALNGIIYDCDLGIDVMPQIGDSMDYHGFILWVNRIVEHMNTINEAL